MALIMLWSILGSAAIVNTAPAQPDHVLVGVLFHYDKTTKVPSLCITDSSQSQLHFAACSNTLSHGDFMDNQPLTLDVDEDGFGHVLVGNTAFPIAYEEHTHSSSEGGQNVMTCRRSSDDGSIQLDCVILHPGPLARQMSPGEMPDCLARAMADDSMQIELMKRTGHSSPLQNPGSPGLSCGYKYPVVKVGDGSPQKKMLCKQMTVNTIVPPCSSHE